MLVEYVVDIKHTVDGIQMAVNNISNKMHITRTDSSQIDLPQEFPCQTTEELEKLCDLSKEMVNTLVSF